MFIEQIAVVTHQELLINIYDLQREPPAKVTINEELVLSVGPS
jgi:hypothetical protein